MDKENVAYTTTEYNAVIKLLKLTVNYLKWIMRGFRDPPNLYKRVSLLVCCTADFSVY